MYVMPDFWNVRHQVVDSEISENNNYSKHKSLVKERLGKFGKFYQIKKIYLPIICNSTTNISI